MFAMQGCYIYLKKAWRVLKFVSQVYQYSFCTLQLHWETWLVYCKSPVLSYLSKEWPALTLPDLSQRGPAPSEGLRSGQRQPPAEEIWRTQGRLELFDSQRGLDQIVCKSAGSAKYYSVQPQCIHLTISESEEILLLSLSLYYLLSH